MFRRAAWFVTTTDIFVLFEFVLPFLFADATLGLAGILCAGLKRSAVPLLTTAFTGMRLLTEFVIEISRPHPVMLGR